MNFSLEQFLEKVQNWAKSEAQILAIALVGSYARGTANKDSDIDIMVVTNKHFIIKTDFLHQFGQLKNIIRKKYGKVTSLHVEYLDIPEIEFSFADDSWLSIPADIGTIRVIQDGERIIYDPKELLNKFIEYLTIHK